VSTDALASSDEMVEAAREFLESLNAEQRATAQHDFPDDAERRRWFYTPTDHGGIALSALSPAQQRRALELVTSGLSEGGYNVVATIMGLDNVLDRVEGWKMMWGRDRGRDPGLYYLRIFGQPATSSSWSWRFGGHHVSINHTIVDGRVQSSTPCFLGADPAKSPLLGGDWLRPLASAEDLAREIVASLDPSQLAQAVISEVAPVDLVGANRSTLTGNDVPLPLADLWRDRFSGELGELVVTIQSAAEVKAGVNADNLDAVRLTEEPKGLPVKSFGARQKEGLRALLEAYIGRLPDAIAEKESARFHGEELDKLSFAWAGSTDLGHPHYYRIQGPNLLVEYDNTQRDANHVHTVWRDPRGDFGDHLLRHYLETPHDS